jgi:O-antigen ligase
MDHNDLIIGNNASTRNVGDSKVAFAIIFQFSMLITNYAVKEILQVDNSNLRSIISLGFMLMVGIMYLKNIRIVLKRIGSCFILAYAFGGAVFLLTMLIFPKNNEYLIDVFFWLFLICFPTGLYYLAIRDKNVFLDLLLLSSYYQVVMGFLIFINMVITTPNYDMVFTYLMLVPVIILTYKMLFIQFKLIDCIITFLAIIAMVAVGSRGPLLAYLIFIMLLILTYFLQKKIRYKDLPLLILTNTIILTLVFNLSELLVLLQNTLYKYGINSRTLNLLLSDNIDFLTGRKEIFANTISHIIQKPIIGYGIAGDRVFLSGTYPHNIFLEIIAQFGVIMGGILIVTFLVYWTNGLFFNKNKTERHLGIIFAGLGLISLFFSGSYLTSSNYWLFMAICVSSVHFGKSINDSFPTRKKIIDRKISR